MAMARCLAALGLWEGVWRKKVPRPVAGKGFVALVEAGTAIALGLPLAAGHKGFEKRSGLALARTVAVAAALAAAVGELVQGS